MFLLEAFIVTPSLVALDAAIVHHRLLKISEPVRCSARALRREIERTAFDDEARFARMDEALGWCYETQLTKQQVRLLALIVDRYRRSALYSDSERHNALLDARNALVPSGLDWDKAAAATL